MKKEKKDETETLFSAVFVMEVFIALEKKFHQNNQQVQRNKTRKKKKKAS